MTRALAFPRLVAMSPPERPPAAHALATLKRGLSRDEAAYIVGVGVTLFDQMVKDGRMPKPAHVGGRVLWDRLQVDRAIDRLFDPPPADDPLDRAKL